MPYPSYWIAVVPAVVAAVAVAAADTAAVPVAAVEVEMADAGDVVGADLDEVVGAGEAGGVDVVAVANAVAVGKVPAEAAPAVVEAVGIAAGVAVVAVAVAVADAGPVEVVSESGADLLEEGDAVSAVGAVGAVGAVDAVDAVGAVDAVDAVDAAVHGTAESAVTTVDRRAIAVVLVADAALSLGLSNMVTPLVRSVMAYPSAAVLIVNVVAMVGHYPTLEYMPVVVPPTALVSPYEVAVAAVLAAHLALQLFRRY